jgi:ferredoxin-NADP reductase
MAEATIKSNTDVGPNTVALELTTPTTFEAYPGQFVLVRQEINGEEETGYYTLSSPNMEDTFEITVKVSPTGTLGPWLANRNVGSSINVDGPFGDIKYTGDDDAFVIAEGPGIGPAIGIAERGANMGRKVILIHTDNKPAHASRLTSIQDADNDISVIQAGSDNAIVSALDEYSHEQIFAFGFAEFVERVNTVLEEASINPSRAMIENFGPK